MKKTKIVATLGPVSESKETLRKMVEAGMNVARLNFSHGTHEWHQRMFDDIREVAKEMGVPIGILADLQGPRIRTIVEDPITIEKGEKVFLYDSLSNLKPQVTDPKSFGLDVSGILSEIEVGNNILIEDGLMKLRVLSKEGELMECEVIDGGIVKNHKGINIPEAKLSIPVITEKDERDLELALKNEADFVAISFVGYAAQIEDLRNRMKKILGREQGLPQIVAKIERLEALKNLDEIIKATDVVMVARGDLAVEVDDSKVAILQKEIIAGSLNQAKPVIVATQMLNSMIENPRPTRAEISDVCNAVIDHTDAVMLSGESASGKYPVESVQKMKEIIESTEESPFDDLKQELELSVKSDYVTIARSAHELAKGFSADAILMTSMSGFTARLVSNFRPNRKLLVATLNQKTYNQLSLVWGVQPFLFSESNGQPSSLINQMIESANKDGELRKGNKAVIITGRTPGEDQMHLIGVKEIE